MEWSGQFDPIRKSWERLEGQDFRRSRCVANTSRVLPASKQILENRQYYWMKIQNRKWPTSRNT